MSKKVYEIVTDKIMAEMTKGKIPWKRPWKSALPMNLKTKRQYNGVNLFLLSLNSYKSNYWLTYDQANSLGGHVKTGEKAHIVVFWKFLKTTDKNNPELEKTIPLLRYYNVFNVEQCEGITLPEETNNPNNPIEECEKIVKEYEGCPSITNNPERAFYRPATDEISVPPIEKFQDSESYYSTLFHEMVHSTGHSSRLNRDMGGHFGTLDYSFEELIAEMGASFLCGMAGISNDSNIENSAAYLQSWMQKFQKDPSMLIKAAGKASKATDWILGKRKKEEEGE